MPKSYYYQTFGSWLQELSQDPLEQNILTGGSPQVFDFICRYGKSAVMEVATGFDLAFKEAEVLLTGMAERGLDLYTLPGEVSGGWVLRRVVTHSRGQRRVIEDLFVNAAK